MTENESISTKELVSDVLKTMWKTEDTKSLTMEELETFVETLHNSEDDDDENQTSGASSFIIGLIIIISWLYTITLWMCNVLNSITNTSIFTPLNLVGILAIISLIYYFYTLFFNNK